MEGITNTEIQTLNPHKKAVESLLTLLVEIPKSEVDIRTLVENLLDDLLNGILAPEEVSRRTDLIRKSI